MIVVSDTTPLISFLKMGRIDLLEELFGQVFIPQSVYNELTVNAQFKQEALLIQRSPFIKMQTVKNPGAVNILKQATGLDQGESEAIILTDELGADVLLMDEAKGRAVSHEMGIRVMGTIGILMAAHNDYIITSAEVRECIDILQHTGRHISQKYYSMLMNMLSE